MLKILSACFGGRGAMSISSLKNLWLCFDYEREECGMTHKHTYNIARPIYTSY